MLTNVDIAAAIANKTEEGCKNCDITSENVSKELALMGFACMDEYISISERGHSCLRLGISRALATGICFSSGRIGL